MFCFMLVYITQICIKGLRKSIKKDISELRKVIY